MINYISIILMGIALSMDAFSLSLSLGTLNMQKKDIISFSLTTSIFHFILPIIGLLLGEKAHLIFNFNSHKILGLILLILSIKIIYDMKKDESQSFSLNIFGYIFFAMLVSIDSFTTGIGLTALTNNLLTAAITFSILSGSFTLLGCILSKKATEKYGKIANYLGLMILLSLSIIYLCK